MLATAVYRSRALALANGFARLRVTAAQLHKERRVLAAVYSQAGHHHCLHAVNVWRASAALRAHGAQQLLAANRRQSRLAIHVWRASAVLRAHGAQQLLAANRRQSRLAIHVWRASAVLRVHGAQQLLATDRRQSCLAVAIWRASAAVRAHGAQQLLAAAVLWRKDVERLVLTRLRACVRQTRGGPIQHRGLAVMVCAALETHFFRWQGALLGRLRC